MNSKASLLDIIPVLPSADLERDLAWYEKHTGFTRFLGDSMYAGIRRDQLEIHLQFHHGTAEDPVNGGSVIRIFVTDIMPLYNEFVDRGTIPEDKLRMNTPWGTHEFGFYDLNRNALFIVQDAG